MVCIVPQEAALTSDVSEVDGLSVWVKQLDDGVVVVLHSTADGDHFPLDHRHVVRRQVLGVDCKTQAGKNITCRHGEQISLTEYLESIKYLDFRQQGLHVNMCREDM